MIISLSCVVVFPAIVWATGSLLTSPVNQPIGEPPVDIIANPVEFSSLSGSTIRGWFIRGKQDAGVIVLMHGVRANRLNMIERARFLSRAGYSVLLFDFQAHGESKGENITFGYLESRDAQAAVDFVRSSFPKERIGVVGISMGGAAVLLAKPQLNVDAVVLEMVYPTIEQAVSNRITARLGNWAMILTPLLTWQIRPRLGIGVNAMRPIDNVNAINSPKLFIVGADDDHTTLAESNQFFATASEPKDIWVIPKAKHVDFYPLVRDEYEQKVVQFFEKHLRQSITNSSNEKS